MNIAVTGGNGRFGRVVVAHLAQRGHNVLNIDRITTADDASDAHVPFIGLDLADLTALEKALEGRDAVVHLAAIPSPRDFPAPGVYTNNTITSYNILFACAELGIKKVCLASSINAIGGAYSRQARYDYFPVDERHPSYNEDAYSLSKWVLEAQADSFARRYEDMTISSLRFHGLTKLTAWRTRDTWAQVNEAGRRVSANHLWAYTDIDAAAHACELALLAEWTGHEAFFITAPTTIFDDSLPSLELARQHYPNVPIRADLPCNTGFYDCSKAGRLLNWTHEEQ